MTPIRLGINIDHVATVRNARGGTHPCPVRAAILAKEAGADGITAHLREDRRHIRDRDIERLKAEVALPLNLEMAATDEMRDIALRVKPHAVCLVPEKRHELTTEGGLDVAAQEALLTPYVRSLKDAGIRVSLFIDASQSQIDAASRVQADIVELHTGTYAHAFEKNDGSHMKPLSFLFHSATHAHSLGLEVHAGHGLDFANVRLIAALPEVRELNIGHFLIGEAVFTGLKDSIQTMRKLIDEARI